MDRHYLHPLFNPRSIVVFGFVALATAEDGSWTGWVTETHCGAAGAKAAEEARAAHAAASQRLNDNIYLCS